MPKNREVEVELDGISPSALTKGSTHEGVWLRIVDQKTIALRGDADDVLDMLDEEIGLESLPEDLKQKVCR